MLLKYIASTECGPQMPAVVVVGEAVKVTTAEPEAGVMPKAWKAAPTEDALARPAATAS